MNIGNLALLTLLFTLILLALQRTERHRRWLTALVLILPSGYVIYRWAVYRGQVQETLTALGVACGLNLLFWLIYGRRHPPPSSDTIRVVGMDE